MVKNIEIAPSILSANFVNLEKDIDIISNKIKHLHLDIMDGIFVPNITFGPPIVKSIVNKFKDKNFIFDTHLMIDKPERYIENFAKSGSNLITIHQESTIHLDRVIGLIKSFNIEAGVALNPATPLETLKYILDKIDLVLIMSVNPGFGGQKFIPKMVEKIEDLKNIRDKNGYNFKIQVDGGVNIDTINILKKAGVDIFVAGSAVFKGDNYCKNIDNLIEEGMKL